MSRMRRMGGGRLTLVGALAALALTLAACGPSSTVPGSALGDLSSDQLEALGKGIGINTQTSYSGTGIHVSGTGVVKAQPDLAIVNLGVEATAKTVAEAREEAASAMNAVMAALHAAGVADKDIATQYYSIQPQYEYRSSTLGGQSVLVGYRVSNQVTAKVRSLEKTGKVVDAAALAGGDNARVNGISFTLENGAAAEQQARELALADVLAKADTYATGLGVRRGQLAYVAETSYSAYPKTVDERSFAAADGAMGAPTPTIISTDELSVSVTIQAVFDIN
ncbi:MAG: SIMPL domain-containing protein [Chloroflexota bacterium]